MTLFFFVVTSMLSLTSALRLTLRWDDGVENLDAETGGFRLFIGPVSAFPAFPFLGDYSTFGGSKFPVVLRMLDSKLDEATNKRYLETTVDKLPSCVPLNIGVTAFNGLNVTSSCAHPCGLESGVSNVVQHTGASLDNVRCVVEPQATGEKIVRCTFATGAYGGTAPTWVALHFAPRQIKANESYSNIVGMAKEGPSPFFAPVSQKEFVVTLDAAARGRWCFDLRTKCIESRSEFEQSFVSGSDTYELTTRSWSTYCVDIAPTPAPTSTMNSNGGMMTSTTPSLYNEVPRVANCTRGADGCSCLEGIVECTSPKAVCRGPTTQMICVQSGCQGSRGCSCDENLECGKCAGKHSLACAADDVCVLLNEGTSICVARPPPPPPATLYVSSSTTLTVSLVALLASAFI